MNGFRVKVSSTDEMIDCLKQLSKINVLGETIVIGTSITNDFYINDIFKSIFNGNKCDYFKYFEIVSISIGFGTDYAIKNYSKILGNKNILVGLDTMEDYIKGDIYKNVISIDEMIEETINLMDSK